MFSRHWCIGKINCYLLTTSKHIQHVIKCTRLSPGNIGNRRNTGNTLKLYRISYKLLTKCLSGPFTPRTNPFTHGSRVTKFSTQLYAHGTQVQECCSLTSFSGKTHQDFKDTMKGKKLIRSSNWYQPSKVTLTTG